MDTGTHVVGQRLSQESTAHPLSRRIYSLLAYHLYAKHALRKTNHVRAFGFTLLVPPTVFHPRLFSTSSYLGEYLRELDLRGKRVLDAGCGSGIISLVAASRGARVDAIDINEAAASATRENAVLNRLDGSIAVMDGDMFSPPASLLNGFDFVAVNPPYYGGDPGTTAEYAWKAGHNLSFFSNLARLLPSWLASGGRAVLVLSSELKIEKILPDFEKSGLTITCLRSRKKLFETLMIYEAARS